MSLSVVILSKNVSNLQPCMEAVRRCEPHARIVVIDDGLDLQSWLPDGSLQPFDIYPGVKPFIFARNANIGIEKAYRDDVVLLNDDALVITEDGLSLMQQAVIKDGDYGIVASSCNNVGNSNQFHKLGAGLVEEPRMVCFVCVLISRRLIDAIGGLDERYVGYGCEDDDYCLMARKAGFKLGVHHGCFADHQSLTSTFRGKGFQADFQPNLLRYKLKWGHDNWGNPANMTRELAAAK